MMMDEESKLERRAWSRKEDEAILRLVQQVRHPTHRAQRESIKDIACTYPNKSHNMLVPALDSIVWNEELDHHCTRAQEGGGYLPYREAVPNEVRLPLL